MDHQRSQHRDRCPNQGESKWTLTWTSTSDFVR
jgi:hypothetical protein